MPGPTHPSRRPRTRTVVLACAVLAVGISPFAVAATGDVLREGVRNGTASRETSIVARVNSTTSATGGYSTRQSNLSGSGGGAIYGCRSGPGGSANLPRPQNPCLRANNLRDGLAFEFNASNGEVAGLITAGTGGDTRRPFTTNATGVATGLNADRVDGQEAADFVAESELLWALVDADTGAATIVRGRGAVSASSPGTGRFIVTFNREITGCGAQATLSDATGAAGPSGEISTDQPSASSIEVNTYNSAGAATDPLNTDGFTVQVLC